MLTIVDPAAWNIKNRESYEMGHLVLKYFFDDYLSDKIKVHVERKGQKYIDMNKEMKLLDSTFEFYTDYCHSTPNGNRFVAEKIGAMMLKDDLLAARWK